MGRDDLYITVPNLFRCPISLDVMESPVSLCTGVTYDRSSIQRWLDSGHNTCPATMQLLPSKDLVPNHTLHRLIRIWSSSTRPGSIPEHQSQPTQPPFSSFSSQQALDLVTRLINGPTPATCRDHDSFTKLLCFAAHSVENRRLLSCNGPFVDFLIRVVSLDSNPNPNPDVVEPGLRLLHLIVSTKSTAVMIGKTHPGFFKTLTRVLKTGRPESRVAVTGIIQTISPDPESKKVIFGTNDSSPSLLHELLQILKTYSDNPNPKPVPEPKTTLVVESVLATLVYLSSPRVNKTKLIRAGAVRIVTNTIRTADPDSSMLESGLTLLETLSGSPEGRAAITDDPNCVGRVINKLMKGTSGANEHGVALIWSLCYLFRDEKAKDAVMKSNGGLTKILLLMQSDCSAVVKRMCCDLLRIFRVNYTKQQSCLASYDSKTTHIMPC